MFPIEINRRRRRKPGHRPKRHHGGHRHVRVGVAPGIACAMRLDLSFAIGRTVDHALAEAVLASRGVCRVRAKLILAWLPTIDNEREALRLDGPLVSDWRALRAELLACGIAASVVGVSSDD